MTRHRDIAGSPVRTAAETWQAITDVITVTLGRSPSIDPADVRRALDGARAAGHALVAGGHLDRVPLTVVADPLYLTISTVSGENAFSALEDENSNPVPGAATAGSWRIYFPTPDGLASLVEEVTASGDHISSAAPPVEVQSASASTTVDLRRLDPARWR